MDLTIVILIAFLMMVSLIGVAGLWIGRRWGRADGSAALDQQLQSAQTRLALTEQSIEYHKKINDTQAEDIAKAQEELRQQTQLHKDEISCLNHELSNAKNRIIEMETISAKDKEIIAIEHRQFDELRQQIQSHKDEINYLNQELSSAKNRIIEIETVSVKDKEIITVERRQFDELRLKFNQEFENLANQIFESKHTAFDAQSREGLNTLLLPFKEQLESFRNRIDQVHTENVQGQTTLKSELDNLRQLNLQITQEASDLTKALKGDKKLQGVWGEQKAELLLEQAGLRKGMEYEREQNFKDDAGNNFRPDFVVNLPERKHIIIDSKVSLVDYSAYIAAETAEDRQRCLTAHVAAIRNHIKTLSDKHYPELINIDSPDFTFLFIAIEPAYLAAVEHTPSLFQEAYDARVALVTATTLLPVLRVVANLWSLQRQNESTQKLAEQASRVYDKLRIFIEKMDILGNQLETAQKTYRDSMNTLKDGRGSLVKTAEKFSDLGVKIVKKLPLSVQTKPYIENSYLLLDETDENEYSQLT
ncbi:MAG: DNA recombination protein RmuC [Holophagales bacterium]|jgi:DNA recombination protein RmuC|nr:DNA recombination protein RmuC [Holophagales bacterium]